VPITVGAVLSAGPLAAGGHEVRRPEESVEQVKFGPELITRLLDHLSAALPGCLGVGLTAWVSEGPSRSVKAIGVARTLDAVQLDTFCGPLVDAGLSEQEVVVADLAGHEKWSHLAESVCEHERMGVVALPGSWSEEGPVVLTAYLDHQPTIEDLRIIDQIEPLLASAAAVIEFCAGEILRSDQMINLIQHRRVIEQAKGLVMAARGCDAGGAFQVLVRSSQHFNVKLRDLCAAMVHRVGGAVEEPDDGLLAGKPQESPTAFPTREAMRAGGLTWEALRRRSPAPGER
jgi:hypothetical protein